MSRIIAILGPESSGTRMWANIVGQHPDVQYMQGHRDLLEDLWHGAGSVPSGIVLTRRSFPHGRPLGDEGVAQYMDFPDVDGFMQRTKEYDVFTLVPVRATVPHLMSWVLRRRSCDGNIERAWNQYRAAYKAILGAVKDNWAFVSMEALLEDEAAYLASLWWLLDLPQIAYAEKVSMRSNEKHYEQFYYNQD